MRYFIDFEATQPGNEIISVGVVSETGEKFCSYAKPAFSHLTPYITQMTGITETDLAQAPTLDQVFTNLYNWVSMKEKKYSNWKFIVFGSSDKDFIKTSAAALTSNEATLLAAVMLLNLQDYSKIASQFFKCKVSLIKAFNYVEEQARLQKHDALEDAMMLSAVAHYVENNEPLASNPFVDPVVVNIKMPSGKFTCKHTSNGQHKEFNSCDEAIDWVIADLIKAKEPEIVHRDRIMKNIMKSVKKKSAYCHFKWTRIKEEEE